MEVPPQLCTRIVESFHEIDALLVNHTGAVLALGFRGLRTITRLSGTVLAGEARNLGASRYPVDCDFMCVHAILVRMARLARVLASVGGSFG